MTRPVVWFRLWRGKVWHVRDVGAPIALCGAVEVDSPERTIVVPPTNARICGDCAASAAELAGIVQAALAGDPRNQGDDTPTVDLVAADPLPGVTHGVNQ